MPQATGSSSDESAFLAPLRRVLGQFCQMFSVPLGGSDDLHLLPVIRKFFSAVETDYIGSGQRGSLGAMRRATHGYGEAIVRVFAPEHSIDQFSNHDPPST